MFIARILFHKYAVAIYDTHISWLTTSPAICIRKYLYCDLDRSFVNICIAT